MSSLPPLSLYLHFPWCVSKCPYCDFNSYTLRETLPEQRYLRALEQDLAAQIEAMSVGTREIVSIFMGGGTPSLFAPQSIAQLLAFIAGSLPLAADAEITLEANPGTIERGRFAEYRAAGVNRVSLGAQSFDAHKLKALGRIHSPADTCRAAEELHAAGLDNFNLDLMFALPGQTPQQALADVEQAIALAPRHLSHYQLTLEPGTPFAAAPPAELPTDDGADEMLGLCQQRLAQAGFARYEVSGYALPGAQCRHNQNYWTYGDYLGVGAGAHGKLSAAATSASPSALQITRTTQWREPRKYLAHAPAQVTLRPVAPAEIPFEFMLNALRRVDGFARSDYELRTGLGWQSIAQACGQLVERGLLQFEGDQVFPGERGLRFLNEALLSFLPPESLSGTGT